MSAALVDFPGAGDGSMLVYPCHEDQRACNPCCHMSLPTGFPARRREQNPPSPPFVKGGNCTESGPLMLILAPVPSGRVRSEGQIEPGRTVTAERLPYADRQIARGTGRDGRTHMQAGRLEV